MKKSSKCSIQQSSFPAYFGDDAIVAETGPFRSLLASNAFSARQPSEELACVPAIGISGLGGRFGKLVLSDKGPAFETTMLTLYVEDDYPLLAICISRAELSLAFILDPFTREGQNLLRNWSDAGSLALTLFHKSVHLQTIRFPHASAIAKMAALPMPAMYDDAIAVPAVVLPMLHSAIALENLVLVTTTPQTDCSARYREVCAQEMDTPMAASTLIH